MDLLSYLNQYDKIVDKIPNFFGIHDLNHKLQLVNNPTAKLLGFNSRDDVVDMRYENIRCKASKDITIFTHQDKFVILNLKKLTFLSYHYYIDEWRLILGEKSPLINNNNDLIGLVTHFMDITNFNMIDISRFLFDSKENKINKKSFSYYIDDNLSHNYNLSDRQMECLFFIIRGKSDKEIAKILKLSPRTIESYINEIKNKMSCLTKAEVIEKSISKGFLNIIPKRLIKI